MEPSTVEITGEVAKPGRYPYITNMHAADLIRAAGGLKRSADTSTADLTRYAASGGSSERLQISLASLQNGNASEDAPLHSGDVLAIRAGSGLERYRRGGEGQRRGHASLQLWHSAGRAAEFGSGTSGRAFTDQAYPYGAVLTRKKLEIEQKNLRKWISLLE